MVPSRNGLIISLIINKIILRRNATPAYSLFKYLVYSIYFISPYHLKHLIIVILFIFTKFK